MAIDQRPREGAVSFEAHVELLHVFLAHRDQIVGRIEAVLNAQRKPPQYLQDRPLLSRHVEDCFFTLPAITREQAALRGQSERAHCATGFKPREIPGLHNGLIDPAEMMIRGFHLWEQTRWPGRNGRIRYAHTLFHLYVIRCLELLSMRVWDADAAGASDRLSQVQGLLDTLWSTAAADQPVFVRDARWLIQLAQSPATDDLAAYFEIADKVAHSMSPEDRIALHMAGTRMAGGHLRSQIRHYSVTRAVSLDDASLLLSTRNSNALDFALLVQDLVPLLEAYERAWRSGDDATRLEVAGVICQGFSPDPELFVNRIELLAAYSMLEHLFVTSEPDGRAAYTPIGRRHVQLLEEYRARIGGVAEPLLQDCAHFRPVAGAYSPYGIIYGFSSDLIEHMTLRSLVPGAVTHFGIEDVFASGGSDKLAWVSGWRQLPHLAADVTQRFAYPHQFAESIFDRVEQQLRKRVHGGEANALRTGRLFVLSEADEQAESDASPIPDLPVKYVASSDAQVVGANKARYRPDAELLNERHEGKCLISYQTTGGWVALTKDILTGVLGAGGNVKLAGLPREVVSVLRLMYPTLVSTATS